MPFLRPKPASQCIFHIMLAQFEINWPNDSEDTIELCHDQFSAKLQSDEVYLTNSISIGHFQSFSSQTLNYTADIHFSGIETDPVSDISIIINS